LSTARTRKTTPRGCPRRGGSSTERSRAAPPPPSPLGQPASTHAAAQELHAAGRPWTRRSPAMDTRVEGGTPLSYGPPWAHYLGGYQDRLLGGPLGLPSLRYTAPEGVEHKDCRGEVLG
jgi:hypothetical protein